MPVLEAKDWAPFKLDALGIIALLGTDSLRQSISRLVHNDLAEYLPLLAPQIIADNTITNTVPGFTLYNITDGVLAIDLSAWVARWLACQAFKWNTTVLDVRALGQKRSLVTTCWFVMLCLNALVDAAIIVFPVLLDDWYGFAASVSLVVTVISRAYILFSLRRSIDDLVTEADTEKDPVKLWKGCYHSNNEGYYDKRSPDDTAAKTSFLLQISSDGPLGGSWRPGGLPWICFSMHANHPNRNTPSCHARRRSTLWLR